MLTRIAPGIVRKTAVLLALLLLASSFSLYAQSRRGDALTLKIALMGPGDEVYFWFGHIGLVVEDRITGQTRFFDWGVFSFDNDNFFANFAFGRLLYSCMVSQADANYSAYIHHDRSITLYTLDLPAEKKEEILRFAENNMLPENRDYYYHQFRDNCANRIRDILDLGLDGKLKEKYGNAPGRYTYRQHVRRHTWFNPFVDWLINFWMGQDIDRPITEWEEMFLPSEIGMRIRDFHYTGPDGIDRALVSSTELLYRSKNRPAVLDAPRLQWPRELLASSRFSALLLALFLFTKKKNGFRICIGLIQSLLGLFFGAAGSALFFMSFFTNHDYTYNNSNILFVNPLFLAVIPLGIIFAFTKSPKKRFVIGRVLRVFWVCVVLGGLLTMVMKLFPAFYQQNQVDQALILPMALTLAFIMMRLSSFKKREKGKLK